MVRSLFGWLRVPRLLAPLMVVAVALLPGQAAAQQPATLTGRVTAESGQPLASAGVIIEQLSAGAVTRPDGSYTIIIPGARVPSGPVTVTARLVGYKARSAQVNLGTGSAVQDFTLPDNPLQLGELVVTGAGTVSEVEKLGTGRSSVDSLSIVRSGEPNVVSRARRQGAQRLGGVELRRSRRLGPHPDPGSDHDQRRQRHQRGRCAAAVHHRWRADRQQHQLQQSQLRLGQLQRRPVQPGDRHQSQRHRERGGAEGRGVGRHLRLARRAGRGHHHHQARAARSDQVLASQLGLGG